MVTRKRPQLELNCTKYEKMYEEKLKETIMNYFLKQFEE